MISALHVYQAYHDAKNRMFDLDNPEPLERSIAKVIFAADIMAEQLIVDY